MWRSSLVSSSPSLSAVAGVTWRPSAKYTFGIWSSSSGMTTIPRGRLVVTLSHFQGMPSRQQPQQPQQPQYQPQQQRRHYSSWSVRRGTSSKKPLGGAVAGGGGVFGGIFVVPLPSVGQAPLFRQQYQQQQYRTYVPMTEEEKATEKRRVDGLSSHDREQELRQLNREIARLEMLKGINTGELYTWTGRYKALARDYGMPLVVWYWNIWTVTLVASYAAIELGGVDVLAVVAQLDAWSGWDLTSRVDPSLGKIGLALLINEILEPARLPFVIVTVKPVMDRLFPPKY